MLPQPPQCAQMAVHNCFFLFFFLANTNYIRFLDSNTLWHHYCNKQPQLQQNDSPQPQQNGSPQPWMATNDKWGATRARTQSSEKVRGGMRGLATTMGARDAAHLSQVCFFKTFFFALLKITYRSIRMASSTTTALARPWRLIQRRGQSRPYLWPYQRVKTHSSSISTCPTWGPPPWWWRWLDLSLCMFVLFCFTSFFTFSKCIY